MTVRIGEPLSLRDVLDVAYGRRDVVATDGLDASMQPARRVIEEVVASERTVYGVTTGFGYLANVRISSEEATDLQRDIVLSHATAVGTPLSEEVVRAMLLLKARTFAFGASGVRPELVHQLIAMLNGGIHPVVPSQGSLGASGDLAPLAHLALPMIGRGEAVVDGNTMPGAEALRSKGLEPIELSFKEGLSL